MSYISFDKKQLVNLEFALSRELVRSNRSGGYASTTIAGCNTRKYHGLLVVPQPWLDSDNHVLLSNLDETIIQHDTEFNLGVRMYPNGVYEPKGHKYLLSFTAEPIPKVVYQVGGVVFSKEMVFAESESRILIRYTLVDAHSKTTLRLKPFLAFRNVHQLTKANYNVNNKFQEAENGVSWQMYGGYSRLFMQTSKKAEYTHIPDWYYDVSYIREASRGFPAEEDLFVPGFFEMPIKKGESIIVSIGLDEKSAAGFKKQFLAETKKRVPRDTFENCLLNSAEQFIVKDKRKTEIMAGFPWFGTWGRDTFIALPGLTLLRNDLKTFKAVVETMVANLQGPLFPNIGRNNQPDYASVDAPLWFFWTLQQYATDKERKLELWKKYGQKLKIILEGYRQGTEFNIRMLENGLLAAGMKGMALTWMDVASQGRPVTPRTGLAVEVNALWFNAVSFAINLAEVASDTSFIQLWKPVADGLAAAFIANFWDEKKKYLADYTDGDYKDWSVRPNMLFAVSLPYSPLDDEKQSAVLAVVKSELLTPRGLRSLAPKNSHYKGVLTGNQEERSLAYHQGTVFPWLISHFGEAWLKVFGASGLRLVEDLFNGFEDAMFEAGIGNISEVYDGDPPHHAQGGISQAWNVAELLRLKNVIEIMKRKKV
jgi:predicted glycogen debranching enzyme